MLPGLCKPGVPREQQVLEASLAGMWEPRDEPEKTLGGYRHRHRKLRLDVSPERSWRFQPDEDLNFLAGTAPPPHKHRLVEQTQHISFNE